MALGPGEPNTPMRSALESFDVATLPTTANRRGCLAGLWLYHDFLDESHTISQDLPDAVGSFWHAIMHRREPDPFNSKYWWRKVGRHSVISQLAIEAQKIGYHYTTPSDFVDFCERVRGTNTPDERLAECVQLLEWQLLFDYCLWAI